MPELPEVENIARELQKKAVGLILSQVFVLNPQILSSARKNIESSLPGKKINAVCRKGKYFGFELGEGFTLWFHLGMTGQILWTVDAKLHGPHVHFVMEFQNTEEKLIFRDIRRFGEIFLTGDSNPKPGGLRLLGPEPFEISPRAFATLFKSRTGKIKSLLLNQRIIAGLGNIYADESLHRAGIHPRKRPNRLKGFRIEKLHASICEVLKEAIDLGGSSIDDYLKTDGSKGFFQNFHRVYGREGLKCSNCESEIRRIKMAGRSSFFCPQCQK